MNDNYRFRAYSDTDGDNSYPLVEVIRLEEGDTWEFVSHENAILYLHYGQLYLLEGVIFDTAAMLILPPGCGFTARAGTAVSLFVIHVRSDFRLPPCLRRQVPVIMQSEGLQSFTVPRDIQLLFTLLVDEFHEGILTPTFVEVKVVELFVLLKAYYPIGELAAVFFPFLCSETPFIASIWNNYGKAKNVAELAALCCCSRSTFQSKFKRTFGVPPYRWFTDRKALHVRQELLSTDKRVSQIAMEQGFSSISQFSDFCKRYLGHSPGNLRKMHFNVYIGKE